VNDAQPAQNLLAPGEGNPEVISSPVGLVPKNALLLSDLANFRVVGNPEAIRFDVVEVARSRFVWHRICDGRFAVSHQAGERVEIRSNYIRRRCLVHPQNASYANEVLAA
jgi:hypothetical protein